MTTSDAAKTHFFPTVAHNSWGEVIILAFLATAGLFYVNIMPALAEALISGLSFAEKDAGFVGSSNTFGAAAGALTMVFIVKKISWRPVAMGLLVVMIGFDFISTYLNTPTALIAIRFIHGCCGGLLVGLSFALITRTANPERIFGFLLALQFGLGGLFVRILPGTVAEYGHQTTFWSLALFSFITLILVNFLADIPPKQTEVNLNAEQGSRKNPFLLALLLTLISIILFQATNMAIGFYLIPLGSTYGLDTQFNAEIVGYAYWVGAMGAILVSVMGLKFGRFWPLTIAFIVTLAGFLLFHLSDQKLMYAIANFATATTWAFVIPFLFGICSELDPSGRMASMAGFCSKVGLSIGPAAGGLIIGGNKDYALLINVTFAGLVVSMVAVLLALYVYAKQRQALGLIS